MFHSDIRARHLTGWLMDDAVPLWTRRAFDPATGLMWEALDHDGRPCRDMPRRLRVQARQVFCLSRLSRRDPGLLPPAQRLFRRLMRQGFDPHGHLVHRFAPDGRALDARHDLYDHAFMLLAAAGLAQAGADVTRHRARLLASLSRLRRRRGWAEDAAGSGPRRQNPHMHLFEAATEWLAVAPDPRIAGIAAECLSLFRTAFLRPDGSVLEFFDNRFRPLQSGQRVEPGHIAEWIFLIDRYEQVTGQATGIDITPMAQRLCRALTPGGLLPDMLTGPDAGRRLWPQTELLRAVLVLKRRGALPKHDAMAPGAVLDAIWRDYLNTPVAGGWFDRRAHDGTVISHNMPVSSFYHVLQGVQAFLSARPGIPATVAA